MVPLKAGHRLLKIKQVLQPRIQAFPGLPDGVSPANVELVFQDKIDDAITVLKATVTKMFP